MSSAGVTMLRTVDDSGLISIVDASAYSTFVDSDWTYEQMLEHFAVQMAEGAILVWECGDGGGDYLIEVRQGFTDTQGFRSALGWLKANNGVLNVASYTALTMAAQFEECAIPAQHESEEVFDVPWRSVRIRIVQMYDPGDYEDQPSVHFVLELEPGEAPPLAGVLWETSSGLANHRQEEPALSAASQTRWALFEVVWQTLGQLRTPSRTIEPATSGASPHPPLIHLELSLLEEREGPR